MNLVDCDTLASVERVAILKGEFGDTGFVELAESLALHALELLVGRLRLTPGTSGAMVAIGLDTTRAARPRTAATR